MKRRPLYITILTLILLAGLSGCNLPQAGGTPGPTPVDTLEPTQAVPAPTELPAEPSAAPTQEPEPAGQAIEYAGVRFRLVPEVASGANMETVPAEPQTDEGPYWEAAPEYTHFTLTGYRLSDTFHQPAILIYPVQQFKDINPESAAPIDTLAQILADRSLPAEHLPFLPIFNAAQMLVVQAQFLDFGSGSGVRYLTQYSQAVMPISSRSLFYTYQGITADGQYYVAAVLPISHPSLPADDTPPGGDWSAFEENFLGYLDDTIAGLNAQPDDSFTPTLSQLDAMMASLEIQR
ncbi:MAG: hypothetical protein GYA17_00700 [Chloroflexi bacterium]|nr:hypothetical protein [Chloroflexota bacterium]